MRLTLRTLLAYLDNTLDEKDARILREKIAESGFATQLVQKIRSSLDDKNMTAPSPDSVHPIAEPNVISEYLDSTLPAEQVAEIERACLEVEPHLAEAAACHQILTMVLGQPADFSDDLRQKMYLLRDAPATSFSSITVPVEPSETLDAPAEDMPERPSSSIEPVGLADSGVSDAPSRLRESGTIDDPAEKTETAIAGSKPRNRLEVSDVYDGHVRPSRITPWLVSLALAGGLLFALAKIFWEPILGSKTASQGEKINLNDDSLGDSDSFIDEATDSDSGPEESVTDAGPESKDAEDPVNTPAAEPETTTPEPSEPEIIELPAPEEMPAPIPDVPAETPLAGTETVEPATPAPGAPVVESTTPVPVESIAKADPVDATTGVMVPDAGPEPADPSVVPPPSDPPAAQPGKIAATSLGEKTLLLASVKDDWLRVAKGNPIASDVSLINAPGFRSPMKSADGLDVTLIGATQVNWTDAGSVLNINFGRGLVTAKNAGDKLTIRFPKHDVQVAFAAPENALGFEIRFTRRPGFDPMVEDNHVVLARVFSVLGDIDLKIDGNDQVLKSGQYLMIRGDEVEDPADLPASPEWVKPPDEEDSIDASAREGLMELLGDEPAVSLGLREATSFRRNEIGSLSAQTLLMMGRPNVFFGGDGILSNPKQHSYWPQHYAALRAMVDRGPETSQTIFRAINEMQAADLEALKSLLVGFSDKQLKDGGDQKLIDLLGNESMSVRVLALENLREITGTTLFFRPQETNTKRRENVIKKWQVRLRKGDIRRNKEG